MPDAQGRLGVKEAAEKWGVHPNTVRNWANADLISFERVGRAGFIRIAPEQEPPTYPEETRPCARPWPNGLKHGILIECDRRLRQHQYAHTGKHMNRGEHMEWWGGDLTAEEETMAEELRLQRDEGPAPLHTHGVMGQLECRQHHPGRS